MLTYRKTFILLFGIIILSNFANAQKIGFLLDDYKSTRWLEDSAAFCEEVKELGGTPIVASCNNDYKLQFEQAKKMINKDKVKVINIVASNKTENAKIVAYAKKKKVKVILYDRFIEGGGDYYVSFDGKDIGRIQAQYIVDNMKGKNIVVINGPTYDYNAILLHEGQMEVFKPLIAEGKIKLLFNGYMDSWQREGSFGVMLDALGAYKDSIDAVLCANDELATGVIEAMESSHENFDFPITGQDGMKQALKLIIEGKQTMTILKSVMDLARAAAQLSITVAKGEKPTIPLEKTTFKGTTILNYKKDVIVVDLNNIHQYVTIKK